MFCIITFAYHCTYIFSFQFINLWFLFYRNFSRTATNWTRVRLVSPFKLGTTGNYFSGCVQLGPRICLWTWTVLERYHRLVPTNFIKKTGATFWPQDIFWTHSLFTIKYKKKSDMGSFNKYVDIILPFFDHLTT